MKSSYNLPHYDGTFLPNGDLAVTQETVCLRERSWDFIVIVAGKIDQGATVCLNMLHLYSLLCSLSLLFFSTSLSSLYSLFLSPSLQGSWFVLISITFVHSMEVLVFFAH